MTGSWRDRGAPLVAPAVSLGLLLLVWAAASGPVAVFSPSGRTRTFEPAPDAPSASPTSGGGPNLAEATQDVRQTQDLSWVGDLIAWAVLILVALTVLVGLRFALRHRWRPAPAPRRVEVEALPEERAAATLTGDGQARVEALDTGSPRNGIVACWARLEDAVADAGVPRNRHETSAEFTVRVLHVLDLDPRAIGDLARLYREARFSEHDLAEGARADARDALARLQSDLTALAGARESR